VKHLFIINSKSHIVRINLDKIVSQIESAFSFAESAAYEIYTSKYPRDAIGVINDRLSKISQDDFLRIYAVGGDGILFDCLNAVVNSRSELTVLPYGGANDFSRNFGADSIPLFRDVSLQVRAKSFKTDVFKCNDNYGMNYCTVGIEGRAALIAKKICKVVQRFIPAFQNCLSYGYEVGAFLTCFKKKERKQYYNLTIDGVDYSGNYAGIFVANGQTFACNKISSLNALIDDGQLNVIIIKSTTALNMIKNWYHFQKGNFYKYPNIFTEIYAKEIKISTNDEPLYVCLDGESFRETHIDIEIIPSGMNFVVPKEECK
jgi:diacylglycerol kinase family enzyme